MTGPPAEEQVFKDWVSEGNHVWWVILKRERCESGVWSDWWLSSIYERPEPTAYDPHGLPEERLHLDWRPEGSPNVWVAILKRDRGDEGWGKWRLVDCYEVPDQAQQTPQSKLRPRTDHPLAKLRDYLRRRASRSAEMERLMNLDKLDQFKEDDDE